MLLDLRRVFVGVSSGSFSTTMMRWRSLAMVANSRSS